MPPVRLSYYSDVLCIWAYATQRRVEALVEKFGARIEIEPHFCPVFPDAWGKIAASWAGRGGFEGFNRHLNEVAGKFPHVTVHERLWLETRPRSSAGAHLFVKAVEIVEREAAGDGTALPPYLERPSARATWALREAFFASAEDISDWRVHARIAERLGLDYDSVERKIRSSEAVAALAVDDQISQKNGAVGSPTFILNDGRQKLYGNIGYRLLEANVQELLTTPAANEASWC